MVLFLQRRRDESCRVLHLRLLVDAGHIGGCFVIVTEDQDLFFVVRMVEAIVS